MNILFDIEANGLEPTVIFCIIAMDVDTKKIYSFDNTQIKEGCDFLLKSSKLIGHNILGYDIPAIESITGISLSSIKAVDTLVLSRLFHPTREGGHGLESWGYRLGFKKGSYGSSEGAWDSYSPEMLQYCINDVQLNEKVYSRLKSESRGFTGQAVQLEHSVAKIIDQQRRTGFLLNQKKCMLLVAELQEKIEQVQSEVHETFKPKIIKNVLVPKYTKSGTTAKTAVNSEGNGVRLTEKEYDTIREHGKVTRTTVIDFNLASRKQIGEYLVEFGWKPKNRTPTGQPIVDEGTLNKVKNIPEAAMIAKYLMLQKRLAQIKSWLKEVDDNTDRVHGYVNPNGAVTSRMTHSHPNMAQIPSSKSPYGPECRSCWTVPKGYKLVGIDASGLELRMLAHEMNDEAYTNEILNGDIHTANQKLAGLESRNQAKTFIYALNYGAGDAKLGSVVGGNREAGKRLRERFFSSLPSFKTLKDRVSREAASGSIKALDGRKLTVRSEHAALNTLLQGNGAIVMKQALIYLDNKIKSKGIDAKFVANVHDEWQLEVKEDQADAVGRLGVQALRETTCTFKLNCPLDGEYKIGDNWYETH